MLALPPPTAITMNNTQLINDISKALREHVCLLHEIDLPCTTSWETLHRLSSGILDRPDVKAGFSEVKSFQNDEVNFYVHCLNNYEHKYILSAIIHKMDQISKNSPESQRLQYLTHVLNSYKNNQLEVVLQRALVLCALYRMPDFMVKDRFKLDYRVLLVHVVDIMVEYTHRAEHRIHTFLYKIQSSKQFEVLRADMFELHPRYHLALKDGTSTLHGTVKYLFENDITIWHGVTKSLPVFENFTLLPYELQVQVLENIPRSTLVHCRLLSRDMNNVVNFTFQKKRQKASNELVEQISTSTVVEKRFGRDMIPYVECRVKSLRRGKWVLPKDYNSTVTLPMERVVYILKGFRFSNEQLERIHPEQKKMLNL